MIRLTGGGDDRLFDVVVDLVHGAPAVVHWGRYLGEAPRLDSMAAGLHRPVVVGLPDVAPPLSTLPEHGSASPARPGLLGHRPGGLDWSPRFVPAGHELSPDGRSLVVQAEDTVAGLRLVTELEVGHALVLRHRLVNEGDGRYLLDGLTVTLPLPDQATELLTFTGRWSREMQPHRTSWRHGTASAENRRGRTSHELPPVLFAGTPGFGEWTGEVWGVHLAWSANHSWIAERLPDGRRYLQLGELLHPGEIVLEPGEAHATPDVVAVHSERGLTPASWGFHRHLRSLPGHPATPRPVLLNTWEAVYFDHDTARLEQLATAAAAVGIERFVLDDGWFGSRRDDTKGLGDWWVSPEVYPDGLGPLVEHVRSLGMEFGIWVEPEMVSPDSDTYRAHPEWALTTQGYEPVLARQQLVLDLARPDAYVHVHGLLDALLRDHDISYLKWDMNRDHVQGSGAGGAAGTHAQTLAVYRLLDELGTAHPGVEIETCSSGGARIDHEILRRTRRVWTSDCNDALERQTIQRGVSMFVPPEVMGAHVGPARAHTTGRVHGLAFRAATALFGHLGVEWDLLSLSDDERAALAEVIALHKRFRPLLHGGDTVRFDMDEPWLAHGVYAGDRSEALIAVALLATGAGLVPPVVRLPDLVPERRYRVEHVPLPGGWFGLQREQGWAADSTVLTGRQLAAHGLRPPVLNPETAVLFRLVADDA